MPLERIESAIPAGERPQNHALDRAAPGIGIALAQYTRMISRQCAVYCERLILAAIVRNGTKVKIFNA